MLIKNFTNLFKVEKLNESDEYELFTMKLILLPLIYKDYINNRKGRIPKLLKEFVFKVKSDKNSKKNLYSNILHYCQFSIDEVLHNECLKYFVAPKKLNIKKQLENGGFANYKKFCNKKLYDIYIKSFPKNIKNSEKLKKIKNEINEENKTIIKYAIAQEKKNKKAEIKMIYYLIKLLSLLF